MILDPERIRRALEGHECRRLPVGSLRPAAVLLPLFLKEGRHHLLFIRRSDQSRHHRGEIAFPGGVRDAGDPDLVDTALREAQEEVGIDPADVQIVGRLDDILSVHGYHVTPFVGFFPWPYPLVPCGREIAQILQIPLSAFFDDSIFRQEDWRVRGRSEPVCFYCVGGEEIWGLTAAVLRQFLHRVGVNSSESLQT